MLCIAFLIRNQSLNGQHTHNKPSFYFIFYASPLWWWWPLCCNDIIWPFTSSTSKVEVEHITGNVWGDGMGKKMTVICFFFEYDNDGMYLWPWCLPYGHIVIWFIHSLIWWPGEREKFSFIYPHTEEAWFSHGFSFFFEFTAFTLVKCKRIYFFLSESLRATCQLVRWWWGWGHCQLFKREGLLYSSSLCYENPIWPTGMSVGLMYRTKLAEYLNLHTYSVGTRANVRQFEFFSFFRWRKWNSKQHNRNEIENICIPTLRKKMF